MATRLNHLSEETRDQLAELALNISGNKETRPGFLGLIKKVAPNTPIPEIDAAAAVDSRIATEAKARQDFEKETRDRWLKEDLARQKNEVSAKFGLSNEDISKMEEMMKKGDLPADYRFAPALYKQQTEAATPTNYGGSGYGPLDLETNAKGLEGLMDDTDNWSSRTAHSLIDDMRKAGKSTAF